MKSQESMKSKEIDIKKLFYILNIPEEADQTLFWQAITHKSFFADALEDSFDHYDRLEFLGDSILKLTINEYLFKNFTRYDSGKLTKLSAYLLSDKTLLQIANEANIKPFVRTGARIRRESVLSDVMEALFGACYLNCGLEAARKLILDLYKDLIIEADESELKGNYKAALQELAQSKQLGLPEYLIINSEGPPHNPKFEVEIKIAGKTMGRGIGGSKKEAGQMAAKASLEVLMNDSAIAS